MTAPTYYDGKTISDAKELIEKIAAEVRPDTERDRFLKPVYLLLDSFAPDHVITEFLQNADDVHATFAKFELTGKEIIVTHNGEAFNENHLRAISDIGNTTKKANIHIGYMGIGFKSSFMVSDTPHVFSDPYRFYFKREDVILPYWLDHVPINYQKHVNSRDTTFILPFYEDLPNEIISSLQKIIVKDLKPVSLIFLKNIKRIELISNGNLRIMRSETRILRNSLLIKESVSVTEEKEEKRIYDYLVFKKSLEIPDIVKKARRVKGLERAGLETTIVTIAFTLKDGALHPEKTFLHTFLPTPSETGLNFTINGDFILTPQRTEIDFTTRWNHWLLECIGEVLKEIVQEFITDDEHKFHFYSILPRKSAVVESLFPKIGLPLIDYMRENPSVLTSNGTLSKPSEVVIATPEFQKVFPPEKAGSSSYVDSRISDKSFLKEHLKIRDVSSPDEERGCVFEALRDDDWLRSLTPGQCVLLYEFLYHRLYDSQEKRGWALSPWDQQSAEKKLKDLKIVRLIDGQFHNAKESLLSRSGGKYEDLPSLQSLRLVDPTVLSDTSVKLLKNLGANDYSEEAIISNIIHSQSKGARKDWPGEDVQKTLDYVTKWLKKHNFQVSSGLGETLKGLVLPIKGNSWATASTCYAECPELRAVLPEGKYVDTSRIKVSTNELNRFFELISVQDYPRVLDLGKLGLTLYDDSIISTDEWDGYIHWLYTNNYFTYQGHDFKFEALTLDGFDDCVESKDSRLLAIFLNFLVDHWDDYEDSTMCNMDWYHYQPHSDEIPSFMAYELKTSPWLPTSKGIAEPTGSFLPLKPIKNLCGDLVPYLIISEARLSRSKEMLRYLGVIMKESFPMLLSILSLAQNVEVNARLKKQLEKIYQRLSHLCADEVIKEEVYLLDNHNDFKLSTDLYWLDDREAADAFGEDIAAIWIPENLSKPQYKPFFIAVGVTPISSILKRDMVPEVQRAIVHKELTNMLREKGAYLYSLLSNDDAGKVEEFPKFIKKVEVLEVDRILIQLEVLELKKQLSTISFCNIDESRIYVSAKKDSLDLADISRELTRTFDASPGSEFALTYALNGSPKTIMEQFQRSSIRFLRLPETSEIEDSSFEQQVDENLPEPASGPTAPSIKESTESPAPEYPKETSTPSTEEDGADSPLEVSVSMEGLDPESLQADIRRATKMLEEGSPSQVTATTVWRKRKQIREVKSGARVVARPSVSVSTRKNWQPQILDGETVYIHDTVDANQIDSVISAVKPFRARLRTIVETMGGNPDTVNVCITNLETDVILNMEQLFFNIMRDDNPLRWIIVAARELAYLNFPKHNYAHTNLMTELIVRALPRIHEIFPEEYSMSDS